MGEVWLVHKIGLERRSALKVIKPEIAQSEDGWRRFEREAQVMAKFNHPNVVTVFDYRRADPFAYIEMEHVHGRDLQKELKERNYRPSSLEWTAQILDQLCSVLQEAHGYIDETDGKPKPTIHRDVKPSNLMLVDKKPPGQNLKVLDFGIAKMIRDDMSVDGTIGFLGTVAYASPEQIQGMESAQGKGSRIDGRSDLYSVGVLLYQLLTGRLPFTGSPLTVASAHLREKPPSMKKVNPEANVPPEVERVVMKCLEKDPALRHQTAHELADAFRRAIPRPVDPVWVDYPIWRMIGATALVIGVIIFLFLPSWLRQKSSGSVGTPLAGHSPTETQVIADPGLANDALNRPSTTPSGTVKVQSAPGDESHAPPATPAVKDTAGVDYVLKSILQDVRRSTSGDRPYARYFSLNHLLTGGATAEELDFHRDALAKAINHLTWEPKLVRLQPIEPSNTIYRIDLRTLGWDKRPYEIVENDQPSGHSPVNLFDLVLLEYPYGTTYQASATFDELASEFLAIAGQVRPIAYIRADWFVSVATQPPLYHDLLGLPFKLEEIEKLLDVKAQEDLDSGKARRGGVTVSGVSRNNRVLERHAARFGAFWESFDFRTSIAKENLFRDPIHLNPAGREILFNLPNGLQGYFLCDAKGDRLEAAPTEIVTDRFSADQVVRNGLSCIRCHDAGMKEFIDTVRPAVLQLPDNPGFDKARVLQLYADQAELSALLKEDADRFTKALQEALGRLPAREPLIGVSQRFLDAPISLTKAAAELGLSDPGKLKAIFGSKSFTSLGLAPLASVGVVRRDTWEAAYDQVVRNLGVGTPLIPLDGLTQRDFRPEVPAIDVALKTSKPGNVFVPGDEMVIFVVNRSNQPVYIELIGTDVEGKKTTLAPGSTRISPGGEFRLPEKGTIRIMPKKGKEQITLLASLTSFPTGTLLRGQDVADRFVHSFYELPQGTKRDSSPFDPAAITKQTITIETR